MLARCPSCRNTFTTERTGRQDCPVCGKPLVVPEAPPPTKAVPESGQAPAAVLPPTEQPEPESAGTPWERRAELGFVQGWLQTVTQALFEPGKLFGSARLDRGAAQLGFAVLTGAVFSALGQILDRLLLGSHREQMMRMIDRFSAGRPLPPLAQKLLASSNINSPGALVVALLFAPLLMLIFVYASAGVTHLFAMLFGQNRRGFAATFAAVSYAFAPLVLLAVPGCGWLIALVWVAVLTSVGLKETHRISAGGAAVAALGPYVLLCCALCTVPVLIALLAAQAMGGR